MLTGLWTPRVLSLLAGLFVSPSASSQLARGRAEARWGPLQGEVRPAPPSFTQILVFCKRRSKQFCCAVVFHEDLPGQSRAGWWFRFLGNGVTYRFLVHGVFFLLLAAQSTSLKEAQEIFKSKQ